MEKASQVYRQNTVNSESLALPDAINLALAEHPEMAVFTHQRNALNAKVERIFSKICTAHVATYAVPPSVADIQMEQTTGLLMLTIQPNLEKLAQYGISKSDIQQQLATSLGGRIAGKFYDGDARADIVVRLQESICSDVDALFRLPIHLPDGHYVPPQELAKLEMLLGANQVNRENGKRRVVVNTGIGSEVQRPLASVVIGGIISSTLLTLFVIPALYRILHKDNLINSEQANAQ